MTGPVRTTQRAPKRCVPCATAHICTRETVIVKGMLVAGGPTAVDALHGLSNDQLLSHIQGLTEELDRERRRGDVANSRASSGPAGLPAHSPYPSTQLPAGAQGDMVQWARRLHFIHSEDIVLPETATDNPDSLSALPDGLLVPPHALITQLLSFLFDELGWLICPVPTAFQAQYLDLHARRPESLHLGEPVRALINGRPAWAALLFALLAVALVYIDPVRADALGVPEAQKRFLANMWFRASLHAMFAGGACLARPSMTHLQAFCALTLVFQPFDCMVLHDTWLGGMMQAGRCLGLHLLRFQLHNRSAAAETGRRIWTFLLCREVHYTSDEYEPSGSRAEQEPFATFLNLSEAEDAESGAPGRPVDVPTRVSYLAAGARLAALSRDLARLPPTAPYHDILKMDERLRVLHDDMTWLKNKDGPADDYPPWVPLARHVIALKMSQRRLYLHRHYFTATATNAEYAMSRTLSLEAAQQICAERRAYDLPFDDKLDTINGILPAAIVLLLDAIYPLAGARTTSLLVLERCANVETLLAPLRLGTYLASSTVLGKTLVEVDRLLERTLLAAQAAKAVFESLAAPMVEPGLASPEPMFQPTESFGAVLDGLSFDALFDEPLGTW